mmetsp:Transcript_49246/g.163062  ORF Transcript_49246/g.163062 Transcript_49246/m.163062 type:complete len:451 (-) Transcript_49246:3012-4364(-)
MQSAPSGLPSPLPPTKREERLRHTDSALASAAHAPGPPSPASIALSSSRRDSSLAIRPPRRWPSSAPAIAAAIVVTPFEVRRHPSKSRATSAQAGESSSSPRATAPAAPTWTYDRPSLRRDAFAVAAAQKLCTPSGSIGFAPRSRSCRLVFVARASAIARASAAAILLWARLRRRREPPAWASQLHSSLRAAVASRSEPSRFKSSTLAVERPVTSARIPAIDRGDPCKLSWRSAPGADPPRARPTQLPRFAPAWTYCIRSERRGVRPKASPKARMLTGLRSFASPDVPCAELPNGFTPRSRVEMWFCDSRPFASCWSASLPNRLLLDRSAVREELLARPAGMSSFACSAGIDGKASPSPSPVARNASPASPSSLSLTSSVSSDVVRASPRARARAPFAVMRLPLRRSVNSLRFGCRTASDTFEVPTSPSSQADASSDVRDGSLISASRRA